MLVCVAFDAFQLARAPGGYDDIVGVVLAVLDQSDIDNASVTCRYGRAIHAYPPTDPQWVQRVSALMHDSGTCLAQVSIIRKGEHTRLSGYHTHWAMVSLSSQQLDGYLLGNFGDTAGSPRNRYRYVCL